MSISNSVVIVNFNSKAALLALLKSLRLQESASGETIVVDSGSFDGSQELVGQFPGVKLLALKSNRGFFAAANKGIDAAVGDVVVVCHSDIIADIHTLAELADATREGANRKIAAVVPRLVGIDESEQPFVGTLPTLFSGIAGMISAPAGLKCRVPTLDHLTEDEWARFVCVGLNRDYLTTTGLFDEKFFLYAGDADLCRRIHGKKLRVAVSKTIQVKHAGASIGKDVPEHLRRILRKDQMQYAKKYFPGWQNGILGVVGKASGVFDRSK